MEPSFKKVQKSTLPSETNITEQAGSILVLLLGQLLEIFLVNDAAELLAASGAGEGFGIQLLVEANGFSAGGANDFKVIVILALAAVAACAVAVALEVIVPILVILVVKLQLVVQEIFNDLQIVVQLFHVVVQVIQILIDLLDVNLNIGNFLAAIINFVILALVVFWLVKGLNKLTEIGKKKEAEKPAEEPAPPEPSAEEKLLTEIRDLLQNK